MAYTLYMLLTYKVQNHHGFQITNMMSMDTSGPFLWLRSGGICWLLTTVVADHLWKLLRRGFKIQSGDVG